MSALVISNETPFGAVVNDAVAQIQAGIEALARANAAAGVAASGFTGTAGTEYETGTLFGVVPSATPGAQGLVFASALGNAVIALATAAPYLGQLDNGNVAS